MKPALLSLTVLAAVAALPAAASAATTVGLDATGTVQVRSSAGVDSRLSLTNPHGAVQLVDAAQPTVARTGCAQVGPAVSCPGGPIVANFGNGDDAALVNDFSIGGSVTLNGGVGNDDLLAGSSAFATANGGPGNDIIVLHTNARGTGTGGSGDDQLAGVSGSDDLSGGPGNDLVVEAGNHGGSLSGDGGADRLVGTGSSATLNGGDGPDLLIGGTNLQGGNGPDRIVSDLGDATIDGGTGPDLVSAINDAPDTIACGPGYDVVWADAKDTVAADCEVVLPDPAPTFPGTAQAIADATALLGHEPTVS